MYMELMAADEFLCQYQEILKSKLYGNYNWIFVDHEVTFMLWNTLCQMNLYTKSWESDICTNVYLFVVMYYNSFDCFLLFLTPLPVG